MQNENVMASPPRKRRGPYMQYLNPGSNVKIPPSTLRSRRRVRSSLLHEGPNVAAIEEAPCRPCNTTGEEDAGGPNVLQNDETPSLNEQLQTTENHGGEGRNSEASNDDISGIDEQHIVDEQEAGNAFNNQAQNPPQRKVNYIKKYALTDRLYQDLPLSRLDVLLMILHLSIRHSHTQPFVEHQIEFVNTIFGTKVLDVSYHIFKELFPSSSSIIKHYFCPNCQEPVGTSNDFPRNVKVVECPNKQKCNRKIKVNSVDSDNYFVTLSLREQIESLLRRPDLKLVDLTSRESDNVSDIFDGELFKKFIQSPGVCVDNLLTLTFNTDGVSVVKSKKNSLYPVFLHLNEVVPEQRFRTENLILGALWFGQGSPNMALYLRPVLEQILELSQLGVKYCQPDGSVKNLYVFPVACSVDSVAKPKVLCLKQFNGYFGCPYCYHPNDSTVNSNNTQRFYDTSVLYPVRTEDEVIRDMREADRKEKAGELGPNDSVNGFLGISILLIFTRLLDCIGHNPFNIVWSTVIDYMHGVLEGVTDDLLELYLAVLGPDKVKVFNDYLSKITPPQAMTRKPRPITEKNKWKAREYRGFLLYYALPCLEDLLPSRHYTNLKHFVESFHILMSDNITRSSLLKAKVLLSRFIAGYQSLYGLSKVTFNLHLLTHITELVEKMGPLWSYSNFLFESGNGRLVKLIKGTRTIINEIALKFTKLQNVPEIIENNVVSHEALTFCNDLLGSRYNTKSFKTFHDVCVTGASSVGEVNDIQKRIMEESNVSVTDQGVLFYHRAIKNGIIYCSKDYTKSKVYDDSCVMMSDGSYAVIDKILESNDHNLLCLIRKLNVAEEVIPSIKKCAFISCGNQCIVSFDRISRKCVFVSVAHKNFVCDIPNLYEHD